MSQSHRVVPVATVFACAFFLVTSVANAQSRRPEQKTPSIDEIFKRLDANRDGKLTKDELPRQAAGILRADANGDEAVTKEELEEARKKFAGGQSGAGQRSGGQRGGGEGRGIAINQDMIAGVIRNFDNDGDSKLNTKELTAMLTAMADAQVRPGQDGAGGTTTHTLQHDGHERTFLLHQPKGDLNGPRPLIIAIGSGAGLARTRGLSEMSDREGFTVVYPVPVDMSWNDGRGLKEFTAMREDVDDVGFIDALIVHLIDEFNIDPTRVYATGMSNAGHMTQRLGVELSHRLAAIAPISASIATNIYKDAKPRHPIGVIMFFGDEDTYNYWKGGGRAGGETPSVPEMIRWWAKHNGCDPEPKVEHLPTKVDDGTRIRRERWGGEGKQEVVLYVIEGGGHVWPGFTQAPSPSERPTKNLNANETMWMHFQRHQRQPAAK